MPRVSVLMPACNAATTIGAAISSVLWQTYTDVELIVVDDGSTDATAEIAASFGGPVTVLQQENAGVSAARNAALDAASGELIALLDADDIAFERHLEALVALYEHREGVATSNCYWLFPGGLHRRRVRHKGAFPPPEQQRRAILEQNFVYIASLFPRALVEDVGRFEAGMRQAGDWDFWLRAIFAGHRVWLQPRPLVLARWSPASISAAYETVDASVRAMLERVARRDDLAPDEREYLRARLAGAEPRVLARNGDRALRQGRYTDAARLYRRAATMCPSERMLVWKARVMSAAPPFVGPLVRERQLRIERTTGFNERYVR